MQKRGKMEKKNKDAEMIDELYEHFYNQRTLILAIDGMLDNFVHRDIIPKYIKTEIKEIRDLVLVANTGIRQIDKIMDSLLDNIGE